MSDAPTIDDLLAQYKAIVKRMDEPKGKHYITRISNAMKEVPELNSVCNQITDWLVDNIPTDLLMEAFKEAATYDYDERMGWSLPQISEVDNE